MNKTGLEKVKCSCIGCFGQAYKFVCVSTGWTPRCSSHIPTHCPSCFYVGLTPVWIQPAKSFETWAKGQKDPRLYEMWKAMQMAKMLMGHGPLTSPVMELVSRYAAYKLDCDYKKRNPPMYCPCCKKEFHREEIYRVDMDKRIPDGAIGYNANGTPVFPWMEKVIEEEEQ